MTITDPARARLVQFRQNRLRNAEKARRAEQRAGLARTEQGRSDYLELAAVYRDTARHWGEAVAEEEARLGLARRQCAECPKRAADGSPFCVEHGEG